MHRLTVNGRDRGAVLPLVALVLPLLILMTAFAVDLGRQRALRRDLQAGADVIALDLVRLIDAGGAAPSVPATLDALNDSLAQNGYDTVTNFDGSGGVTVEWGRFQPPSSPGGECPRPIVTEPPTCFTAGGTPTNSVKVTLADDLDYFFQPGQGSATRSAVASVGDEPTAEFLLGSTLASINPGQGALLGGLLGNIIPGADLLGYGGLANAQVTLADLAVNLGLGSPNELVDATVPFGDLMIASAQALQAQGNAAAAGVINNLIGLGVPNADVAVGDLLGLNNNGGSGLDGSVGIGQLLAIGSLAVANQTNAISIPAASLGVPGLLDVTLDLSVIEAPIRVGTSHLASGSTTQVDLGIHLGLNLSASRSQDVCGLPPSEKNLIGQLLGIVGQLLQCLLGPVLKPLDVRLQGGIDLALSLSEVTGTQRLDCTAKTLTVDYDTGPVTLTPTIGVNAAVTFGGKSINLLGVSANGTEVSADGSNGSVVFDATDSGPRHVVFDDSSARIGSPSLGLAGLLQIGGLDVTVLNVGLPVIGGIAKGLVEPALNVLLGQVDDLIITELSKLLGLNLGGADITPQWMECGNGGVKLVG